MSHPRIITTPAPRRSFPLSTSPSAFFTGDLFDRIVLFLHEHNTTFTTIECVARGIDKASALADGPALCICILQDAAGAWGGDVKADAEERGGTEGRREPSAGADRLEGAMEKKAGHEDGQGKADPAGGAVDPQCRDHGRNDPKKKGEGGASNGRKDGPVPSCGRNLDEGQGEEKPDSSTRCLVKSAPETKPQNLDNKKQGKVLQPQTVAEQKTNACISRIAKLFCKSEVALTIPPEILTIEFVSVILHKDSKVDT